MCATTRIFMAVVAQKCIWRGIGGGTIVEYVFLGRPVHRGRLRRLRNEWKFWAPLQVSTITPKRVRRSCGATFVAMMQTAHLGERDDVACRGRLYAARLRTVLIE